MRNRAEQTLAVGQFGRRAAFTLVELTVVIAMSSIVLGSVGVLLNGAWRIEKSAADHRALLGSLSCVSQQFRSDVHTATAVEVQDTNESPAKSKFIARLSGDRQIEYSLDERGLNRIVRSGDRVTQRETYRLPPDVVIDWQVDSSQALSEGAGRLASLLINYHSAPKSMDGADARQFRVDAVVGLSPETIRLAEATQ